MDETLDYLEARCKKDPKFSYEVIVVSDGSKDKTGQVALAYSEKYGSEKVKLLNLAKNRGKGGAVVQGMIRAGGKRVIFADADGATLVDDVEKLEAQLAAVEKNGLGIAVGSRHHLVKTDAVVKVTTVLLYFIQ
jgi:dolichyl-phosphate beta-glucosyltransferase